jgi:hypothetical protein
MGGGGGGYHLGEKRASLCSASVCFCCLWVALRVRDSRQNEKKRKKGCAKKKKNGGNEWTGPPILNQAPRSTFKNLILITPTLLRGLHQMSLLKSVPEGLRPRECKHVKLHEPPPVPYVPTKDEVQDEVVKLQNLEIKTTIKKDTTLNFQVWHKNGTHKAFLMHVTAVLDAIKKRGHFYNYEKAAKDHEESTKAVEPARAALSLLNGPGTKAKKSRKKSKEVKKDATVKVQDSESDAKEAKDAPEADDEMKAGFLGDLEKAMQSQRTAKGTLLPQTRCLRSI